MDDRNIILGKMSIFVKASSCAPSILPPKHTIYAFIIYSQICALFVSWKERK